MTIDSSQISTQVTSRSSNISQSRQYASFNSKDPSTNLDNISKLIDIEKSFAFNTGPQSPEFGKIVIIDVYNPQ